MRHNVELPELDRYRDYLRGHLRDHHFPQLSDKKFIEARVDDAYDRFITELENPGSDDPFGQGRFDP